MGGDLEYWEVWYPHAAATGVLIARGRWTRPNTLIVHARAGRDDRRGHRIAAGPAGVRRGAERTQWSPMCRLRRNGGSVTREDIWPVEGDIGPW